MTESTGYRLNHATADYEEEHNDRALRAMEQLHGAVNTAVKDLDDPHELVAHFRTIMEAATCVADTLCQGNEETGRLMIHELDRVEESLAHRAVQQTAVQPGEDPEAYRLSNGYIVEEQGKPPDFVLEIASPGTKAEDNAGKRDFYARHGVVEYWRFDEEDGPNVSGWLATG